MTLKSVNSESNKNTKDINITKELIENKLK